MTVIDLRTTQFLTLKAALLDLVSHDDIEDYESIGALVSSWSS